MIFGGYVGLCFDFASTDCILRRSSKKGCVLADGETASLLGSAAIILGGIGGAIALLDWALPKRTKEVLNDKGSDFWLWLSYQKTWPYIRALRSRRAFNIYLLTTGGILPAFVLSLTIVFAFDPTLFGLLLLDDDFKSVERPTAFALLFAGIATVSWAVPVLIYYALRRISLIGYLWATAVPNVWHYLGRFLLLYILVIGATVLSSAALITPLFDQLTESSAPSTYLPHVVFFIGWLATWIMLMITWMATMGYVLLAVYILLIFLMIAIFRVLNFIVLRLLEFDKGPLLGISAALTALGTVLKAFA